ncbi:Xaa-Pro peptidase family protein [Geobacter sulfurreducens]|uniref:Prolidase family protein n=1 Tax=Geobacter sulfurreducens (strain ATCC 51573 / DSM 12127 / PCA) TaxID=243231 RepID=Q74E59_GEOSL|nr:Xaa-Pro peptidase family protein [Geobacter sulfurreducens]AAR34431.1 prolidase family protein [Geobacter sulfurreducens PCA]ADI83942.2 prolidase family protein [Geobacter sulfurreducens KN400]UAC05148.1 Xaa-Pro peptidase family protein [Geobacter sulfurreducens]UTG93785.1 aminopeptidase P family protein [Geobacter sulfurreducens]HBB69759.1 aminopeptidase P family protein [Geobacter sulfurreducens]
MRITPREELDYRISRLQTYMAGAGLDAVIIVQNADLFYFTGTIQSGNLYVPVEGDPIYMVRKEHSRARMESGLKLVVPFSSMKNIPGILADHGYSLPARIGMELDVVPVAFFERYRAVFPNADFSDATPLIRRVRMIKSKYEIHLLQDAAVQVDKVHRRAMEVIREGMTDLELAAELEFTARKEGHQGLVRMRSFNSELFYAHIFSGTDTAVPAYVDTPLGGLGLNPSFGQGAGLKRIERNEPIIVDFAGCVDGYLVDQTRVLAIGGISDRLRRAYDDMIRVQERMITLALPGTPWGDVYEGCRTLAEELGYADSFMGSRGAQVSFIGHGIGIEIDEYPFIARGFSEMVLEPGMVFAFEPKVVFPGEGAIGIENTFYISNYEGLKQLTFSDQELVIL